MHSPFFSSRGGAVRAALFLFASCVALVCAACSGSAEVAAQPTIDVAPAAASTAEATAEPAAPAEAASGTGALLGPSASSGAPGKNATQPVTAPAASAQVSHHSAPAEQLFDEGRAALNASDFKTACTKFEASLKLDFALGTLMNLAYCTERLGDKARACGFYNQAAAEAHARGQTDREQMVQSKRTALGCTP